MSDKPPIPMEGSREAAACRHCGSPVWRVYHGPCSNHTLEPRPRLLEDEAVEAAAKNRYEREPILSLGMATWDAFCEFADGKYAEGYRDRVREDLEAAIKQAGEGKGADDAAA